MKRSGVFIKIIFFISIISGCANPDSGSDKISGSDNDNSKICYEIENVSTKIKNLKENELKNIAARLINDQDFLELREISLENNKCGVEASAFLSNFYSYYSEIANAKQFHQQVLNYAEKGNKWAINDLCNGYASLTSHEDQVHHCQLVLDDEYYDIDDKGIAAKNLTSYYFKENDSEQLFNVCLNKNHDYTNVCLFSFIFPSVRSLANLLFDQGKYLEAFNLYSRLSQFDDSGLSDVHIAEMYQMGKGVPKSASNAIYFYKKAYSRNPNASLRSGILAELGAIYWKQEDYIKAFNYSKQSAFLGDPIGQFNLAKLYLNGLGVITDYQEAYAWISVALSQGLGENQEKAIIIKNRLKNELGREANMLRNADELAKKYYAHYIKAQIPE